jgi:two-component system, OmpR family, phosphate regulon response regulator PhoB
VAPAETILVVDDESDLRNLVAFNLRSAGFVVEEATCATEAMAIVERVRPAVIVLDLMLPDRPGTEVCRELRGREDLKHVAVIMLTARSSEYDRVLGFEVGADDYVVKPFSVRELMMRVRALTKRYVESGAPARTLPLRWGDLELDTITHRVLASGAEVDLRRLEYKLLRLFLENPGRVFLRSEILDRVWGTTEVSLRTVDTHVRRLREKLGTSADAINTVPGFGYRLRDHD